MIGSESVYEIDPRRFRKDRFYTGFLVVFWLVWLPVTLAATYMLFHGGPVLFLLLWCTLAWAGVLVVPLALWRRNRPEILTAIGDRLELRGTGLLPRSSRVIHGRDLEALTLEHHDDESVLTLNLFSRPGRWQHRVMLAAFVHPDDKLVLFDELAAFLAANGFQVEVRNERRASIPDAPACPPTAASPSAASSPTGWGRSPRG